MERPATPPQFPAPVSEIERHVKWRVVAIAVFIAMLAGLLGVAAWDRLAPRPPLVGLPADPDVAAARELVRGLAPGGSELRFESVFLAADSAARPLVAADGWRVSGADSLIERARARRPRDPRLALCAAHLDLARQRYADAERGYRSLLYFRDHVPEAHLGLGVTLAFEAGLEPDLLRVRALQLQAAAQFAAVREHDATYLAALYDRAVMLEQVGRGEEARRWARAYIERDPSSSWAEKLRRRFALSRTGRRGPEGALRELPRGRAFRAVTLLEVVEQPARVGVVGLEP